MSKSIVSVVKYEEPLESVRKVIELSNLFSDLPKDAKVFIKPNIVYWSTGPHPKWGVITTSRVMEDVVTLLKERGIDDITIGEGFGSNEAAQDAFKKLGYYDLKERFGVELTNTNDGPFEKIDIGCEFLVNFASDPLKADFIISLPVLKTHSQAVVSLGMKNLKGFINIASRKKFHSADPIKNLHFNVSKLPNNIPPCLTLIDGIYTLERGPSMDGKAHKSNILIASKDILSADMVGANILGIDPYDVPHIVQAAEDRNRSLTLSDVEIVGEKIEEVSKHHEWKFIYNDAGDLPLPFYTRQFKGLKYREYDTTMCTYCSEINGLLLILLKNAWNGETFGDIEFLTGKIMEPSVGMNKTILVGQCQYKKNRDHPNIKELVPIRGCPPSMEDIKNAFEICGIKANPLMFQGGGLEAGGVIFLQKYKKKPEFKEDFYKIKTAK